MAEFYHLTLYPKATVSPDQIEKVLNLAVDWYRYKPNCWILYTTSNADQWYLRLDPLARPEGEFLILKIDVSDYQGFMPLDLWEWIKKHIK